MPLSTPQKEIFDRDSRFAVCSCGRRFGKTFLSIWEIARVASQPNKNIFYIAPTYRQAKMIMWEMMKDEFGKRRWIKKINESDLQLTLKNDSKISLRSAENFDSMRGTSLDFAVLDEAAYMSPDTWTKVIRPALSDRNGSCLFISTPNGMANWYYDLFLHATTADGWTAHQYTTLDGGNVPEAEVEAAKNDLDAKTFKTEYLATFESAGNVIYYAFNREETIKPYTDELPRVLHIGCDFNINPMSAVVAVKTPTGLHIIDEVIINDSNTDEIAQEIKSRYPDKQIVVYPDPAGAARKTSAGGRTDHTILTEYGFTVKSPRGHMPVKDRINTVNRLLQDANGNRNLFIDPKCKQVINCISKHQYKEGTQIPDKTSGLDHANDALGYMVSFMYPLRREVPKPAGPQLFGHY